MHLFDYLYEDYHDAWSLEYKGYQRFLDVVQCLVEDARFLGEEV
jgi:hypothetical protein